MQNGRHNAYGDTMQNGFYLQVSFHIHIYASFDSIWKHTTSLHAYTSDLISDEITHLFPYSYIFSHIHISFPIFIYASTVNSTWKHICLNTPFPFHSISYGNTSQNGFFSHMSLHLHIHSSFALDFFLDTHRRDVYIRKDQYI